MSAARTLFVGIGASSLAWYRCALPAMYLKQDWIGVWGDPPKSVTGHVQTAGGGDFNNYDIVVIQQPRGAHWLKVIRGLKARGVLVLAEFDDYLHGIRRLERHDFSESFTKKKLAQYEVCMREVDGIICSTEYIARRYSRYGKTYVCENGLDLPRYELSLPQRAQIDGRDTVTLGWAGGTGHARAMRSWLPEIVEIMRRHRHVCFATIGQDFTNELIEEFGPRVVSLPFTSLENYPAAMTLFDVALAPTQDGGFFRGKSTLRVMEASALGIPSVATMHYEDAMVSCETGLLVARPQDVAGALDLLVTDDDARRYMGEKAREKARAEFGIEQRVVAWKRAINDAWVLRDAR